MNMENIKLIRIWEILNYWLTEILYIFQKLTKIFNSGIMQNLTALKAQFKLQIVRILNSKLMSINHQVTPLKQRHGGFDGFDGPGVFEGGNDVDTRKIAPTGTPDANDKKFEKKEVSLKDKIFPCLAKKEEEENVDEPTEFEILCMDLFLQQCEFNDGFMIKSELVQFQEFLDTKKLGDNSIRETLWTKIQKFDDGELISFVTFCQILNDAGYKAENLKEVSLAIYEKNFGSILNCLCFCVRDLVFLHVRFKGVKAYIQGIVKQEGEIQKLIDKANGETKKKDGADEQKDGENTNDNGDDAIKVDLDANTDADKSKAKPPLAKDKSKEEESDLNKAMKTAQDFAQSANTVYTNITGLIDQGSDFYLFYELYLQGMAIIENPQDNQDADGNWNWKKWSYQIVIVSMFLSLASNFLISFSSYIYLLLYKGFYDPESFKRLNCCQALSRFFIMTFLGPSIFLVFKAITALFTIVNFFALFFGKAAVDACQEWQWRFYEVNFAMNIQEFTGFSQQQKISQLFFSSLPTTITNILIINKVLDCSELVEETPKAIYTSLVMSFVNISSTLASIYMDSRGFQEGFLSYSMHCLNAKNGWIPFIHKIQGGNLDQSLNYFLLYCIQPQLTSKVCYYKQFSYQFNDQTIQTLAQDLNLWQQNRNSGLFPKKSEKYWLHLGRSVKNVSVTQLHYFLSGLDPDLIEVSLSNVGWKRCIKNAKAARHIIEEKGKKYEARTPSHTPCLQICMEYEGFFSGVLGKEEKEKQDLDDKMDVSLKIEDRSKIKVESGANLDYDSPFDERKNDANCLLNDTGGAWICTYNPGQTFVEFDFGEAVDLDYIFMQHADCPAYDPLEITAVLYLDGKEVALNKFYSNYTDVVAPRYLKLRFNFTKTTRADKIKFVINSIRALSNNTMAVGLNFVSIEQIEFYVKNPDFSRVDLKIKNLQNRVSYQNELEKCFDELLADGADPDILNIQGETMLAYAAKHKKIKCFEKLLKAGADINKPCADGKTTLQVVLEIEEDSQNEPLYHMLRLLIQHNVDLNKKVIKDPTISPKTISGIHYIMKRMRTGYVQLRDDNIQFALEHEDIYYREQGEERQQIFRQAFRCFRIDSDNGKGKFKDIFPQFMMLMRPIKLTDQRDTKGNTYLHIILKEFSNQTTTTDDEMDKIAIHQRRHDSDEEEGYLASSVSTAHHMGMFLQYIQEFEPTFTKRSLHEHVSTIENKKGQWPLEVAMEFENTLGIFYALKFLTPDQITEKKQKVIKDWLMKQGMQDHEKLRRIHEKKHGSEERHPIADEVYWENIKKRLGQELLSDWQEFLEEVKRTANSKNNRYLKINFGLERNYYEGGVFESDLEVAIYEGGANDQAKVSNDKNPQQNQAAGKAGNGGENWGVIFFIFILEFSATFDLAGDLFLLWAMLQEDTAWAVFTVYCMLTPYFVSYAPLVNYQIENWRVKKQEALDVTCRMSALAWVTLTPGIIIYIFIMDVIFLIISSVLTPIFFLIHLISFGKLNFTMMLDSTDGIYEKMFEMKRLDVNGFRRLRTISQLVFESVPQILLQCYILWYSNQPQVIEELNGEKLLGIDKNYIYGSVIFAFTHLCMESTLLLFEAKACRTSFLHYLLICLNGRLGWVPYTNILQDPEAPTITKEQVLNFEDISAKTICGRYSLEYEFGDKTASTLAKQIMLLQQSFDKTARPSIKLGATIDKVSFVTFLNLLYFSDKRVNLDIDDVNFEAMFTKSQKYVAEVKQAKENQTAGEFLISLAGLGHVCLLKCIVKCYGLELSKVKDNEELVATAIRNKEQSMVDYLLKEAGIKISPRVTKGSAARVPEGFRKVYVDELTYDKVLDECFKVNMETQDVVAVMNGWVEGTERSEERWLGMDIMKRREMEGEIYKEKDMNKRSENQAALPWMYVNEAYPICLKVRKIYKLL